MKRFIAILILVFTISCSDEHEKEYYSSGNLKSEKFYDSNHNLVKTVHYYDSKDTIRKSISYHQINNDSVVNYFSNHKISSCGNRNKIGQRYGKWDFYVEQGHRRSTREFFIIKGKEIVNQLWFYNEKGDTLFGAFTSDPNEQVERGVITRLKYYPTTDTISIAEPLRAIIQQRLPLFNSKGSECYVVLAKEKYNFNHDFSNDANVKLDTFYCVGKDEVNKKELSGYNPRYAVAFGRWFDSPGKKTLRGYLVEKYIRKATPDDSIVSEEGRVYFEKIVYVKDTIK